MPFSAQQLAGLSEGQREAITRALGGVGAFQPFLQQGAEAIGQGIGQLGTTTTRDSAGIDPTSLSTIYESFYRRCYCNNSTRHCR